MEETARDSVEAIVARETWSQEDQKELSRHLFALSRAPSKFKMILAEIEAETPEIKGATALKIGVARYMLCRFNKALEALAEATDNKDRRYFQAMCYKNLRQYDKAAEEFQRARDRGWDAADIDLQLIELQAIAGDIEAADKALSRLESKIGETAEFLYRRGLVNELTGNGQQAVEDYQQAMEIAPDHAGAMFRLAYYYDLHGQEEQAIELYKQCLLHPPIYANALLNLAVLYEDAGQYDKAIACLRAILAANPNHQRARLFLKDVHASKTMYYDEDQAKRIAKRNALMDIPVSDFELSVRARNCLKKMNIRTLGDLVNITETELLSYKNFGETSLKEIKEMLTAKHLHLGQALEEDSDLPAEPRRPATRVDNEGVLATSVERIEFSMRARRALEILKITTLGELASKTEAELLSCRNFGQTSLNEIRERLGEFGLQLREAG